MTEKKYETASEIVNNIFKKYKLYDSKVFGWEASSINNKLINKDKLRDKIKAYFKTKEIIRNCLDGESYIEYYDISINEVLKLLEE